MAGPTRTLLLLLALGTACGGGGGGPGGEASARRVITVDGSSTVYPITEAVAEEFQKVQPGAQVTVGISGTGGGFKKLCSGQLDIADASRTIKPSELELCAQGGVEFVELQVAYDGIAIVVNPKNDWADRVTVAELKAIWEPAAQAKVTKWSHVRPGWPDREIHLYGAGVDSGTYDYFTEVVVGKQHASRGDYTSSEDDNVIVQGVAGDEAAMGFFGFAYFAENRDKLRAVPVDDGVADNGSGPIAPSPETIRNGTYRPLSRPVFIYVARKSLDVPQVASFVDFYLKEAARLVGEVGYVPLPESAYAEGARKVQERRTGTASAPPAAPGAPAAPAPPDAPADSTAAGAPAAAPAPAPSGEPAAASP